MVLSRLSGSLDLGAMELVGKQDKVDKVTKVTRS